MKRILLFPYHPDVELLAAKASELKGYCIAGNAEPSAAADGVCL